MDNFGNRLRQLRKEKGLTQEELGKVFNMKKSRISQYETNKRQADDETKKQLAHFFNVSIDYLIGYSDIRNSDELKKLSSILSDPDIKAVLKDYDNWSVEDKKEHLAYLKAKKIMRDNEISK